MTATAAVLLLLLTARLVAILTGLVILLSPYPSLLERAAAGILGWGLWWLTTTTGGDVRGSSDEG